MKELNKRLTTIRFAHNGKGSEFGTPKGVESKDTNVEILEDFIEKLGKGQPKVCKAERMSVQPNISVKSIKDSLVRFGKYDIVLRGNRVEFEEVGYLYPCKLAGLSTNGILNTHSERNKSDDLTF
ncbi:hypothetical protein Tco_0976186 [Tanacetum coccineum]|uniref:Uncharacterized protein n=1 Tax=Tanacetum coccineum TaxID=301880 RepID=A0ABQ5EGH4_9ASTR